MQSTVAVEYESVRSAFVSAGHQLDIAGDVEALEVAEACRCGGPAIATGREWVNASPSVQDVATLDIREQDQLLGDIESLEVRRAGNRGCPAKWVNPAP